MSRRLHIVDALLQVAERWSDPDYEPRLEATSLTLDVENRFTEEAVVFAVNQQLALLTRDALVQWMPANDPAHERVVGVVGAGNVPFADFQDFLAVLLSGHRFLGKPSARSPHLLRAFAADLKTALPDAPTSFATTTEELLARSEALIATGTDETIRTIGDLAEKSGRPKSSVLLRGTGYGVAVLDGRESAAERSALAEDVLLHEGLGCRSVALLWVPAGLSPDPYLDVMARFRTVFPPSQRTVGALKMPEAFLAATDQPHAVGDGFLMSKGEPEIQIPGHVRWAEYESISEVSIWLTRQARYVQVVVAPSRIKLPASIPLHPEPLGKAQRPALNWCPSGVDTMRFLSAL